MPITQKDPAYQRWKALSETIQAAAFFDIDPKWMRQKFGIEVTGPRSMGGVGLSMSGRSSLSNPNNPSDPYDPFF